MIMVGENTHHNWSSLWKVSECGVVDPSLQNLHHLLLAFALVLLTSILALVLLPRLGAVMGEVSRAPIIEASVGRAWLSWRWWSIKPEASRLLRWVTGCTLLWSWPSHPPSLLR